MIAIYWKINKNCTSLLFSFLVSQGKSWSKTHWLWQLAFISHEEGADLEETETKWLKRVIKLLTFLRECSDFEVAVSQRAQNTSSPFACSPKALKEMTLIFLCISDWIAKARKVITLHSRKWCHISFCKVSTATEAPYSREKTSLRFLNGNFPSSNLLK